MTRALLGTGGIVYAPLETPFPHMSEEEFLSQLADVPDADLRTLVTLIWKDLESARADLDRIAEHETVLREAMAQEAKIRDVMIQKVIDLHVYDPTAPELCKECLEILPCPTLRALGES